MIGNVNAIAEMGRNNQTEFTATAPHLDSRRDQDDSPFALPNNGRTISMADSTSYRDDAVAELGVHAPENVDVAVLEAESLLILHALKRWRTDGASKEGMQKAIGALRRAMQLHPNHKV